MKIRPVSLPGAVVIDLQQFADERGYFMESFHREKLAELGFELEFVQDNVSFSTKGVLRGLHYQWPQPQGKLVTCLQGRIWDVAVDIREGSSHFGQWHAEVLDSENPTAFYIPEGFAHGFCVLSETALVAYKCTAPYRAAYDAGIAHDDPDLAISWPVSHATLSAKDRALPQLSEIGADRLPSL